MAGVSEARLLTIAAFLPNNAILPGASHVQSSVSIAVGNPDISSVLDKRSDGSKICIGSCGVQRRATKSLYVSPCVVDKPV